MHRFEADAARIGREGLRIQRHRLELRVGAADHAVARDLGARAHDARDVPVILAVAGVVVRRPPEVGAHHDVDLIGQAERVDLSEEVVQAEQEAHELPRLPVVRVVVRVEASEVEVRAHRDAGFERVQGDLRLAQHVLDFVIPVGAGEGGEVAGVVHELHVGELVAETRQSTVGLPRQEQRAERRAHRGEALLLAQGVDTLVLCLGDPCRRVGRVERVRAVGVVRIDRVGVRDVPDRARVANACERYEARRRVETAAAQVGERHRRRARRERSGQGCERRVPFAELTAPNRARAGVVVVRRRVDAVQDGEAFAVLFEEALRRLNRNTVRRVGDRCVGNGPRLTNLRRGVGVVHCLGILRVRSTFGIAEHGRVPAASGVDHDPIRPGVFVVIGMAFADGEGRDDRESGEACEGEELASFHGAGS